METVQTVLTWLSVAVGALAAYLWYRASDEVVCKGDKKAVGGYELGMMHPWAKKVGKPIDLVGTMAEGSRLNKLAAIATAIAVLLQAFATGAGAIAEREQNKICQTGGPNCQTLAPESRKG
jgi:hypothetical protein